MYRVRRPVMAAAVAAFALTAGGCGSSPSKGAAGQPSRTPAVTASPTPSPTPSPSPSPTPSPTPTVDPGTLPQTMTQPVIDADFMARLQGYWRYVLAGSIGPGNNFFFPRTAYLQLKTIPNAGGDFDTRLYHDYRNDVMADHQLVTSAGPGAKVLGVDVPAAAVHWVPPGVEYNSIGYWEVMYARVRYEVGGQQKSYAIDSMISWRGQWYVVHLGPDWRPGAGGWVCKPDPPTTLPISAECLRG